jgi:hypothetical protein
MTGNRMRKYCGNKYLHVWLKRSGRRTHAPSLAGPKLTAEIWPIFDGDVNRGARTDTVYRHCYGKERHDRTLPGRCRDRRHLSDGLLSRHSFPAIEGADRVRRRLTFRRRPSSPERCFIDSAWLLRPSL